MNDTTHYIGNELELFSHAHHWKSYYKQHLAPYITGRVLEVGAGIGETTAHLLNKNVTHWTCLEPDKSLAEKITEKINDRKLPADITLQIGTSSDYPPTPTFDSIIYIDVIEHIEYDADELKRAAQLLKPRGHLVILVPAHQWLFSPFDKAIGHFRRYNKKRLREAIPSELQQLELKYLDSFGLFASLANKVMLRKSYPSIGQVKFWDNYIVPVSKIADPLFGFSAGKTLIGIWKKI